MQSEPRDKQAAIKKKLSIVFVCAALVLIALTVTLITVRGFGLPTEQTGQPDPQLPIERTVPLEEQSSSITSELNLTDERVELMALIFRLAGDYEYNIRFTDYHRALDSTFWKYIGHDAVQYTRKMIISSHDVCAYALHIKKDFSGFEDDLSNLVGADDDSWTLETALEFWPLVLDFYHETNFHAFYQSKIPFYVAQSAIYRDDPRVAALDTSWFKSIARFYGVSTDYQYIVCPSLIYANLSAWGSDGTYYAFVSSCLDTMRDYYLDAWIAHEYIHSFSDEASLIWYLENSFFRELCEASRTSDYGTGFDSASEHMVRAYSILYYRHQGDFDTADYLLLQDYLQAFSDIEGFVELVEEFENREKQGLLSIQVLRALTTRNSTTSDLLPELDSAPDFC